MPGQLGPLLFGATLGGCRQDLQDVLGRTGDPCGAVVIGDSLYGTNSGGLMCVEFTTGKVGDRTGGASGDAKGQAIREAYDAYIRSGVTR